MFKFPFDTQICYIKIGNIVDIDEVVNAMYLEDRIDFTHLIKNNEFRYGH